MSPKSYEHVFDMKRVLCILENGFEEIETITPVNLLRRADVEVVMAGISSSEVVGRSGIHVRADALLEDVDANDFDVLFLPGGPAVMELRKQAQILDLIRMYDKNGKIIAAICAAPLLLKDAGILDRKVFTAHFTTLVELSSSNGESVVEDENLITSRGAGTALVFGLKLITKLLGDRAAADVSKAIMA
jgi:4-methyl-5(b-hydroxyethyl)-thiazole monophosphate biosynthesis